MPEASLKRRHSTRSGSASVISGKLAGQPYHSPSKWMPSIVLLPRHTGEHAAPLRLNLLLLPKTRPWAIILLLCTSALRANEPQSRSLRPDYSRNYDCTVDRAEPGIRSHAATQARLRVAREFYPRPGDGCGSGRKFGASRDADGHGRNRRCAVESTHAPQPGQSTLAEPRSLHPVEWSRFDAAVCAAASDRLRPASGRIEALPAAAFEDAGTSRSAAYAGGGDDHGPARPRLG